MKKPYKRLAIPYMAWLYIFALLPILVMVFLSFVKTDGLDFEGIKFSLNNFKQLSESSTLVAFRDSLWISVTSALISAVLGYLVAYKIYRSHISNKFIIVSILILPMWCNILLRTEALGNVFQEHNILSDLLSRIGIIYSLNIRGTYPAVIIGLVLTYMPYMILPIYNALEKIDPALEEAASDLGMTDLQKFYKVVLPLSFKGVVTGSIMTLLPCLSGFAIPEILGSGNIVMIGNVINSMYLDMNYNIGSLLGIIIVVVITLAVFLINKIDKDGDMLI